MEQKNKVVELRIDPLTQRRAIVYETAISLRDTVAAAGIVIDPSGEIRIVAVNIEPEIASIVADAIEELADEIRLKRELLARREGEKFKDKKEMQWHLDAFFP